MKLDADGLTALFAPIVEGLGFRLWGVEYRPSQHHAVVKIYIDHDDGISVDNCSDVSHQISGVLDVEDPISVAYTLEVSSPGVERPLMKREHYLKYVGEEVKVRLSWALNERKNFLGQLTQVGEDTIEVKVDGELFELPLNAVKRANLVYREIN